MGLWKTLEIIYYKYFEKQIVGVKRNEFHDPELYQSDLELMPRWMAVKKGYQLCPNCFCAERPHGKFDDTRGELDWEGLKE